MHESIPVAPQAATHAMSTCGTYMYRCRHTCYTNCSGGNECTGEKLHLAIATPVTVHDGQTPVPAAWTPLTNTPPDISES